MTPPAPQPTDPRRKRRLRSSFLVGLAAGTLYIALEKGPDPAQAALNDALAGDASAASRPESLEVKPLHPPALALGSVGEALTPRGGIATRGQWAIPAAVIDPSKAALSGKSLVQVLDDGTAVELTLDPSLQKTAEDLLMRYRVEQGVIIAIRPKTGEILAMAEVSGGLPSFKNVALQAAGPVASVFKLITSATLLESANLDPDTQSCVHGGQSKLTLYNLKPSERLDTKCETFAQALGSSNNVAFARWADQLLKPAQLQAMADRFLFGKRLPFLWTVGVAQARIPTASRLGFARAAAGFEGSHASPLQVALVEATIANHGLMMAPYLVRKATRDGGNVTVFEAQPTKLTQSLDAAVADRLQAMTESTTLEGTGRKYFLKGQKPRLAVKVGGKSGSLSQADDDVGTRHYSWFVASAPLDDAEIAVTALVVQGEAWTVKGAVLARDLLESYFAKSGRATRDLAPEPQVKGDPLDE